jgi:hypothetical protein
MRPVADVSDLNASFELLDDEEPLAPEDVSRDVELWLFPLEDWPGALLLLGCELLLLLLLGVLEFAWLEYEELFVPCDEPAYRRDCVDGLDCDELELYWPDCPEEPDWLLDCCCCWSRRCVSSPLD